MNTDLALSIVIPAYNYGATLERAVRSVLGQLDHGDELLIIDDGSQDHTPQVVAQLEQDFPERFRAYRKQNGGAASARNLGIELATKDWLIFLDADDELLPGALSLIRQHLSDVEPGGMVVGGHIAVDEAGNERKHIPDLLPDSPVKRLRAYLLDKTLAVSNGASVIHRAVFRAGLYPEAFRNAEDIPVFAQAFALFPVSRLPEPLACIHKHDDSLRHHIGHGQAVGTQLVDEVFRRLPLELQCLRKEFHVQRCLSLFRSSYIAGDKAAALIYFREAYRLDWKILLKFNYSRKLFSMLISKVVA